MREAVQQSTIGILQCGAPPLLLRAEFGSYGEMTRRLIADRPNTVVFDVTAGELPVDVTAHGAYILTGSPASAYDTDPWIGDLLAFLQRARGHAKLVGICFGHQAMAQAFGGSVIKSPKGWGIGLHRYQVTRRAAWIDDVGHVDVAASHQDQVVVCPPGAQVCLASEFTPFAGLDYGDAISFQFHPEFGAAFGTALLETRRNILGPLADAAIKSYRQPDDRARVAGWISAFLDDAGKC